MAPRVKKGAGVRDAARAEKEAEVRPWSV